MLISSTKLCVCGTYLLLISSTELCLYGSCCLSISNTELCVCGTPILFISSTKTVCMVPACYHYTIVGVTPCLTNIIHLCITRSSKFSSTVYYLVLQIIKYHVSLDEWAAMAPGWTLSLYWGCRVAEGQGVRRLHISHWNNH